MKKLFSALACILLLLSLSPPASADAGPKPSVTVTFTGIEDEPFYATLLSENRSSGPARAWDKLSPYPSEDHPEDERIIWEKFVSYQDSDGYYFLQEWWDCTETHQFHWSYYPPEPFKILLYFPERDSFSVSFICERYAFHSFYRVNLNDGTGTEEHPLKALPTLNISTTLNRLAFGGRIALTILLELGLAWCIGYREGRHIILFVTTNLLTQVVLNTILSLGVGSPYSFSQIYLWAELLVFLLEAAVYAHYLPKISAAPQKKSKAVLYALGANILSFAAGLIISLLFPGIFI